MKVRDNTLFFNQYLRNLFEKKNKNKLINKNSHDFPMYKKPNVIKDSSKSSFQYFTNNNQNSLKKIENTECY